MSEIIVVFDGQCELCKNSIAWVSKKLVISAIDFHTTDLSEFDLDVHQCSREVFVLHNQIRLSGAKAVAYLLSARGDKMLAMLITALGPFSTLVYKWIANHRRSWSVKMLSRVIKTRL